MKPTKDPGRSEAGAASTPPEGESVPPQRDGAPSRRPDRRRLFAFGFVVVSALVLVLLVVIFRPVLHPLLWAAALATLVYPAHRRLLDVVGGRRTVAATLSTAAWIAVALVPSLAALNQLASEAQGLWPQLQARLGADSMARAAARVEASPFARMTHLVLEVPEAAGAAGLEERFRAGVESLGAVLLQWLRALTLGAPGALLQIGVTIVAFFFFLRQGPGWVARLREALPLEQEHADALLDTVTRTLGAVFRGVLLTALTQASLATLGYTVAGAPVPMLLGFLTLIASLLPFVGAASIWVPTAVGIFLAGRAGTAIGLAIYGTLVVSLVDNFLRPYLIGRDTRLPILWLFLAIVGGLQAFGFLGLLLGPAALALFLACYRIYVQMLTRGRAGAVAERSG